MSTTKQSVAVIGLGFVGLPLALSYAMNGYRVIGVDVEEEKVAEINSGQTHLIEEYEGKSARTILQEMLASGRFIATTDYREASEQADNFIVTVGLPVTDGKPDDSHLLAACRSLAEHLQSGDTVLIRSTVVPGMTEEVILPLLTELSGLEPGHDFYLAYASERIAEGRAFQEFRTIPVALGAINDASYERALALIQGVTEAEVVRSSIRIVEAAKVIENVQRDVNIAMVQEVARLGQAAGFDTHELIRVANTHPRVNLLSPGPGVGGYCLPYALYYLLPFAEKHGVDLPLMSMARRANDDVPYEWVARLQRALQASSPGRSLDGMKVAVFGLAMKDYSSDDRVSPAHTVVDRLLELGADVYAYDPEVPRRADWHVQSADEAVKGADALFLLAVQRQFADLDWHDLISSMNPNPFILDTKHYLKSRLQQAPPHRYLGV